MNGHYPIAIVGAGFSGAVIAHELAHAGITTHVFDSKPHTGGNCHTERDSETGIMIHKYGPHIFHTNDVKIWAFVNQLDVFHPFINRVKAISSKRV